MSTSLFYMVVLFCVAQSYAAEQNSSCTTPNGEKALCIPIHSCNVIQEAILSLSSSAIEFARNSQCGYDESPLVCCGTSGYPVPSESPPTSRFLPNTKKCGMEIGQDRVFGGQITEIGEFPWMALLEYQFGNGDSAGFKCGGSLINNRYVITAAHCIVTNEITLFSVRLGEWRISTEEDCHEHLVNRECSDPVLDIRVEEAIAHPQYSRRTGDNDIGLLRLEKYIEFTEYISPICLPIFYFPERDVGTVMTIAGWGSNENSSKSDLKLKAEVPIVALSTCQAKNGNRGAITERQVCAGGIEGRDACQGDSGGPLMGTFKNKTTDVSQWYLEGIIAWGVGCAKKDYPGIYTRVAKYMMWILETMTEF